MYIWVIKFRNNKYLEAEFYNKYFNNKYLKLHFVYVHTFYLFIFKNIFLFEGFIHYILLPALEKVN